MVQRFHHMLQNLPLHIRGLKSRYLEGGVLSGALQQLLQGVILAVALQSTSFSADDSWRQRCLRCCASRALLSAPPCPANDEFLQALNTVDPWQLCMSQALPSLSFLSCM